MNFEILYLNDGLRQIIQYQSGIGYQRFHPHHYFRTSLYKSRDHNIKLPLPKSI